METIGEQIKFIFEHCSTDSGLHEFFDHSREYYALHFGVTVVKDRIIKAFDYEGDGTLVTDIEVGFRVNYPSQVELISFHLQHEEDTYYYFTGSRVEHNVKPALPGLFVSFIRQINLNKYYDVERGNTGEG